MVEAAMVEAALALNLRYLIEVVEAFDFCPFAARARLDGRVPRRVILERGQAAEEAALGALASLEAATPAACAVGLLIFPHHDAGFGPFCRFADRIQTAYEARFGAARQFVPAVFHPASPLVDRSPRSLVGFIRRSPDPMLQYTRRSLLDEVKKAEPAGPLDAQAERIRSDPTVPLVERIARANYDTVMRVHGGPERLLGIYADLAAERARRYGALTATGRP